MPLALHPRAAPSLRLAALAACTPRLRRADAYGSGSPMGTEGPSPFRVLGSCREKPGVNGCGLPTAPLCARSVSEMEPPEVPSPPLPFQKLRTLCVPAEEGIALHPDQVLLAGTPGQSTASHFASWGPRASSLLPESQFF